MHAIKARFSKHHLLRSLVFFLYVFVCAFVTYSLLFAILEGFDGNLLGLEPLGFAAGLALFGGLLAGVSYWFLCFQAPKLSLLQLFYVYLGSCFIFLLVFLPFLLSDFISDLMRGEDWNLTQKRVYNSIKETTQMFIINLMMGAPVALWCLPLYWWIAKRRLEFQTS